MWGRRTGTTGQDGTRRDGPQVRGTGWGAVRSALLTHKHIKLEPKQRFHPPDSHGY